jgi:hypothetical protein
VPKRNGGLLGQPARRQLGDVERKFLHARHLSSWRRPWLFIRGNHESCNRNPVRWFTFLDPRRCQSTCQRFTEPYVATLRGISFAVIDSAEAAHTSKTPEEAAEYWWQFDLSADITPRGHGC